MDALLVEYIGMGAGSGEYNGVPDNFVNKKPIWFEMQFSVMLPCSFQRMIPVRLWQQGFRKQEAHGFFHFFHRFSTSLDLFEVSLKLRSSKSLA